MAPAAADEPRASGGGRRGLLAALAGGTAAASATGPAGAVRLIGTEGAEVAAYEFAVSLEAVARKGSIPQQQMADFKGLLGPTARATMQQLPGPQEIYKALGERGGKVAGADVVSLGDAWLESAIRSGLLQPIPEAQRYRWWNRLSPRWRRLLVRDKLGRISNLRAVRGPRPPQVG